MKVNDSQIKKLFVTGCNSIYKNISSISEAFTIVFNYKPCVNLKNQMKSTHPDEIHAPFSMLSAWYDYNMCVKTSIEKKRKNTQTDILKPDESNKAGFSQEVRQILGFDRQFWEAAN